MPETTNTLTALIGQTALVRFETVYVSCKVIDSRFAWGRTDLLVEPISGHGSQWVEKSRVKIQDQKENRQ